jgi:hypothetical protein
VCHAGCVLLDEHLRDELPPAAHADLLEDRLQMILNGVRLQEQRARDLVSRESLNDEPDHVALPLREAVGLDDQRRDLRRPRRLDDHGRSSRRAAVEERAVQDEPVCGELPSGRASINR